MHESKVKNDFKAAANVEKPRQLFWEKRLNGKNLAFLKKKGKKTKRIERRPKKSAQKSPVTL